LTGFTGLTGCFFLGADFPSEIRSARDFVNFTGQARITLFFRQDLLDLFFILSFQTKLRISIRLWHVIIGDVGAFAAL